MSESCQSSNIGVEIPTRRIPSAPRKQQLGCRNLRGLEPLAASHVIHFGFDECRRTPVMRAAGMQVNHCLNIPDLQVALRSKSAADLICISETQNHPREDALVISRALSAAPIVLFRHTSHHYIAGKFDLEIEPLTPPDIWLIQMDGCVHSHEVRRQLQQFAAASGALPDDRASVRKQGQGVRLETAERRSKPYLC